MKIFETYIVGSSLFKDEPNDWDILILVDKYNKEEANKIRKRVMAFKRRVDVMFFTDRDYTEKDPKLPWIRLSDLACNIPQKPDPHYIKSKTIKTRDLK